MKSITRALALALGLLLIPSAALAAPSGGKDDHSAAQKDKGDKVGKDKAKGKDKGKDKKKDSKAHKEKSAKGKGGKGKGKKKA